jgi:hypothetical protein
MSPHQSKQRPLTVIEAESRSQSQITYHLSGTRTKPLVRGAFRPITSVAGRFSREDAIDTNAHAANTLRFSPAGIAHIQG